MRLITAVFRNAGDDGYGFKKVRDHLRTAFVEADPAPEGVGARVTVQPCEQFSLTKIPDGAFYIEYAPIEVRILLTGDHHKVDEVAKRIATHMSAHADSVHITAVQEISFNE